jgi:hypothetical protein
MFTAILLLASIPQKPIDWVPFAGEEFRVYRAHYQMLRDHGMAREAENFYGILARHYSIERSIWIEAHKHMSPRVRAILLDRAPRTERLHERLRAAMEENDKRLSSHAQ